MSPHGRAVKLRAMTMPTLYGATYSVYTRIARLALLEKQVVHRFEEIDIFAPEGPPAHYRALHPFARIPALVHGDFRLYETAAIARYVDEGFPGPPLQAADPQGRARVAQITGLLDAYAYRAMVWDVFVERVRKPLRGETPDEARIAAALDIARRCLAELERFLEGRAWLAGEGPSLADLHAAPMLACFHAAPEGARMLEGFRALSEWHGRMERRPAMRATPSPMIEAAATDGAE